MKLTSWFALRGPRFVLHRGSRLLTRYSLTPEKATSRVLRGVELLAKYGCAPTLPTPGRVVQNHAEFIRRLQGQGVEIAVHSYDHIDLNSVPIDRALEQLEKAIAVFDRLGIEHHGFRCPYLRHSDELLDRLPAGLFGYSSNKAVAWEVYPKSLYAKAGLAFAKVGGFYHARSFSDTVCVPVTHPNLVEIPVCTPDDIQFHDGLNLDSEGIARAWIQMLNAIYRRGELFNLVFHPELILPCYPAFERLLQEARRLQPLVWIARLQDVEAWWREKASNRVTITPSQGCLRIAFHCSPRSTVLIKGLDGHAPGMEWGDGYRLLAARSIDVPALPRPFLGVDSSAPTATVDFLREQGFIVETGKAAETCSVFLDKRRLAAIPNNVELVSWIDESEEPLVRYGRWPDGARSAMCISGDMDALSLLDYLGRLVA